MMMRERERERERERDKDRQTDRQTDSQTDRQVQDDRLVLSFPSPVASTVRNHLLLEISQTTRMRCQHARFACSTTVPLVEMDFPDPVLSRMSRQDRVARSYL